MKNIFIGIIIGIILCSGIAWAKSLYIILQDQNGNNVGTVSNPLVVTTN